jgi:hypothetical protein
MRAQRARKARRGRLRIHGASAGTDNTPWIEHNESEAPSGLR